MKWSSCFRGELMDESLLQKVISETRSSRNYRELDLPEDMLRQILMEQAAKGGSSAEITSAYRKKVHNIVAPYLEKIDYRAETEKMLSFFHGSPSGAEVKSWSAEFMAKHASTRERLGHLETFCQVLLELIGRPTTILDLACALDPLMLPWLGLPQTATFYAYDIHKPRVDFLNRFFSLNSPNSRAIHQDVLAQAPLVEADCVFFFKEAHRFEKRRPGCNGPFLAALNAPLLLVSLPASDLSGHHSLTDYHTQLITRATAGRGWTVERVQVVDELLFVIRKGRTQS